jgi:phage repressor protein C with HTH and peptisase S24 domain
MNKLTRLLNGETFVTKEFGHSMTPLINSGQQHIIEPATWNTVQKGDIVYCKVKGAFYTHLVKAINAQKGCLIGSNKGKINGWTKKIYGKVIEVL